jgi:hypothetical protein
VEQLDQELEKVLTDELQRLASEVDPAYPAILTGHFTLSGATYGSDHVRQDAGRRLPGLVGPSIDSRTTSIPVDLVVGPYDGPDGVGSPFATADTAVWLFLPKQRELARLTLELAMRAGGKRLRRYRFNVTLES